MYFFEKVIHSVNGEFLRIFVLTVHDLTVCKVTFNCKLQKTSGQQDVLVAPPIILFGVQLLSCCSGSRAYQHHVQGVSKNVQTFKLWNGIPQNHKRANLHENWSMQTLF